MPMKKITFILLAAIGLLLTSCSCGSKGDDDGPGEVYICTGLYAEAYHYDRQCMGLQQCGSPIEFVSLEKAEKMGRHPCGFCAR